jgi:hypothetical protein
MPQLMSTAALGLMCSVMHIAAAVLDLLAFCGGCRTTSTLDVARIATLSALLLAETLTDAGRRRTNTCCRMHGVGCGSKVRRPTVCKPEHLCTEVPTLSLRWSSVLVALNVLLGCSETPWFCTDFRAKSRLRPQASEKRRRLYGRGSSDWG